MTDEKLKIFGALAALLSPSDVRQAIGDAIRPLNALAIEWGLEASGLKTLSAAHGVRVFRVGRQYCVRVSELLAAVSGPTIAAALPPTLSVSVSHLDRIAEKARKGTVQ
jgi:hypothetical protein